MDKQRGRNVFIFSKSKRIALICNYDLKKKDYIKEKGGKKSPFHVRGGVCIQQSKSERATEAADFGILLIPAGEFKQVVYDLGTKIIFFL